MGGGWEEIVDSFRNFGLGQDGTPASKNGDSFTDKGNNGMTLAGNHNPSIQRQSPSLITACFLGQDGTPARFPSLNESMNGVSFSDEGNNGVTLAGNQNSSIQKQSPSSWNYQSNLYCSGNHVINDYKDYNPVMGNQFSDEYQKISGTVMGDQFSYGKYMMNDYGDYSPERGSQFSHANHTISATVMEDQFSDGNHLTNGYRTFSPEEIKNDGYLKNNTANPTSFPYQVQQNSSLLLGLQRLGDKGNHTMIQTILEEISGSMFEVMADDIGHHVFEMLVDKCNNDQLQLIVKKADRQPDRFIGVALTDNGSKSIRKLIQRIKKIPIMAITITRIFCRKSFELMTHKTASHIIRHCFVIFGEESIYLFLESMAPHLLNLATDKVGCISLNNFLDSITGDLRIVVLEYLAENSLFLSNEPSGNFVVQHLLDLNNQEVTEKIIHRLTGNIEQLAQKQGGSHVLEKCMMYSELGLETVVSEICKNGKTLLRLARDQFGNYVIQTALKRTKMMSDKKLYMKLLDAFSSYHPHLLGKARGRHVLELIKDDLALHKAKSYQLSLKDQF